MSAEPWPLLGCGVGLRNVHYDTVVNELPSMDWFEAVSENFMDSGGRPSRILEKIREHYPVVLHGTSLSIASCDLLDGKYIARLKELVDRVEPAMVSDHLCWCGVDGDKLHDLLPVPFTEQSLGHIIARVSRLQDILKRPILLENVSSYISYPFSEMPEWEFLREVSRRSGCGILLDVNNIYVNAFNHNFNPMEFLEHIPAEAVGYFHLSGHTDHGNYLFDTHNAPIIKPVWNLYSRALSLFGRRSTLIEWDENIPDFERLSAEAAKARVIYQDTTVYERSSVPPATKRDKPASLVTGPELIHVQRWLKGRIHPEGLRREDPVDDIELCAQRDEPGENRLAVYSDGYRARIHAALSETYPAVQHLVGSARFGHLAEAYAAAHPSRDYNLTAAGRHFPEFLAGADILKQFPFLSDLARLEWYILNAFHAFDPPALDPAGLKKYEPRDFAAMRILFQPSLKLLASDWPVLELWEARKIVPAAIHIDLENHPQKVMVSRDAASHQVLCEELPDPLYGMIEALRQGRPLGEVLDTVAIDESVSEDVLQNVFSTWMRRGLIYEYLLPAKTLAKEVPDTFD